MTTDDLLARLEREARKAWLEGETSDVLDAAAAEVRALTARLDAAHTAIRQMTEGGPEAEPEWDPADYGWSAAEAAEIRAATADPTPQTDTKQ